MRLDFSHTGGQGAEIFAVERIVIEPLPWPGDQETKRPSRTAVSPFRGLRVGMISTHSS